MSQLAGLTFLIIIILVFAAISFYLRTTNTAYKYKQPNSITMLRLLYKYKDAMQEQSLDKKARQLDEFEDELLDFIARHEELEHKEVDTVENLITFAAKRVD